MQVRDIMSRDVRLVRPDDSLRHAAEAMAEIDAGFLPVEDNDRMIGVITDRDIALRGIGLGKGPDDPVREVMSTDVKYCFADDDIDEVSRNMADIQVRRLPVVDSDKRLVGMISIGDIALAGETKRCGEAMEGVARKSGQHNQGLASQWEHRGGAYDAV